MEKPEKIVYEAPTVMVVEIKAEGAILTVSGDSPQYEGPYEF